MLDHSERRLHSLSKVLRAERTVRSAKLEVLPDAAKLAFRGRPSAVEAVGAAFGINLPQKACRMDVKDNRAAYWLGPDEWLLTALNEQPEQIYSTLNAALTGHSFSLVDVSHRSDALGLTGPYSAYVMNHGCPLDLSIRSFPVGMCTRTIIGKASVLLSRPRADRFEIDVWRSFAPYVWHLLDEARSELA